LCPFYLSAYTILKGKTMSVLVGLQAPDFTAEAVVDGNFEDIKLSSYRDKSYVVLFFYPMDFTSVCNTEMHAFAITYDEFKKRDAEVLACSVDSKFSHLAWLKTPKNKGGIEGTKFPILSDLRRTMVRDYDVLCPAGFANRGLFIIDKSGSVRHQTVNQANVGRSVDEVIRTLDAIRRIDKHGDFCPANWSQGKTTLTTPIAQ
jgi:peroxiredoxin (alkyl hydroperoxide reductase subunit C)